MSLPPARIPRIWTGNAAIDAAIEKWRAAIGRLRLAVSAPLEAESGPQGTALRVALPRRPFVLLSGSSSPYSGVEVHAVPGGTWAAVPGGLTFAANIHEANEDTDLDGKVARVEPGVGDEWRFQWKRTGEGGCEDICITMTIGAAGTPFDGAPIELYEGEELIGTATTDAEGVACFPIDHPGAYWVYATPSGFDPILVDVDADCDGSANHVPINLVDPYEVTIFVYGCTEADEFKLEGATVTITGPSSQVETHVTGPDGGFSFHGQEIGLWHITITHPMFVTYEEDVAVIDNFGGRLLAGGPFLMNADTDERCCGFRFPTPKPLFLTNSHGTFEMIPTGVGGENFCGWTLCIEVAVTSKQYTTCIDLPATEVFYQFVIDDSDPADLKGTLTESICAAECPIGSGDYVMANGPCQAPPADFGCNPLLHADTPAQHYTIDDGEPLAFSQTMPSTVVHIPSGSVVSVPIPGTHTISE